MKLKYIRTVYGGFVLFAEEIPHASLEGVIKQRGDHIVSAGFCHFDEENLAQCYGESVGLRVKSLPEDTEELRKFLGQIVPDSPGVAPETDFAELVKNLVLQRLNAVEAEKERQARDQEEEEVLFERKCATLLRACRQTKAKHPSACISFDHAKVRIAISAFDYWRLRYNRMTNLISFEKRDHSPGRVDYTSAAEQDILPQLLSALADCLQYSCTPSELKCLQ